MSDKNVIPVQENMWKIENGKVVLLGSICEDCGEVYFPAKDIPFCACCGSEKVKPMDLAGTGTVDNMVTVDYRPAGGFYLGPVPFTELVVKMDDEVMVPGHLTGAAPEDVHIGDRVEIILKSNWKTIKNNISQILFMKISKF